MDGYQQKTGYFPDVEKWDQRIYIFANAHEKLSTPRNDDEPCEHWECYINV